MPDDEPRCGYPTNRVIPDLGAITKKQPYGRHLKRYTNKRDDVARGKFLVLHATKGWRVL